MLKDLPFWRSTQTPLAIKNIGGPTDQKIKSEVEIEY
jgi:hypothetical protein